MGAHDGPEYADVSLDVSLDVSGKSFASEFDLLEERSRCQSPPAGLKPNFAKRSARYAAALSAPGWPVPRPSNFFELSLVVISRMLSSLIRPVAFRSVSVSVLAEAVLFAGLLAVAACLVAVAAPPCHANAVDESKVGIGKYGE
jgi:hypothetical protein